MRVGRNSREELLWTDCSPIPCSPAPLREEVKVGNEEVKFDLGWEERVKVGVSFVFVSHYPILFLIGNKLSSPSRVYFACDSNW